MKRLHAVVLFVLGFAAGGGVLRRRDRRRHHVDHLVDGLDDDRLDDHRRDNDDHHHDQHDDQHRDDAGSGKTLPPGVRVAGVRVGGLAPAEAVGRGADGVPPPLPVVVDRSKLLLDPTKVAIGVRATAVARARIADARLERAARRRGARPCASRVASLPRRSASRARRRRIADVQERQAVPHDGQARPHARHGAAEPRDRRGACRRTRACRCASRTKPIAPTVTVDSFAEVIVINRSTNRLSLYDTGKLRRIFKVATGQAIYPTPAGVWHIVVKWKNPWWYPPTQDAWAKGLKPVPPGPNNPLGTRWMGLDAPGVGIHGTDEPASIGYSASHGCIRMQVPDAEWLFDHVDVGTTVYIV